MEIRKWAERILTADTLEEKLLSPEKLTDADPGSAFFFKEPIRPQGMHFQRRSQEEKLPSLQELHNPDKRAICLHRFAGHELLAVEIMAYTLCAFPKAPKTFRLGVAHTLKEEQGHVRLYIHHMQRFNLKFGDLPLFRHFWAHVKYITSPLHYVSMMNLTFEMANLDFAYYYGTHFAKAEDKESANLMAQILHDEISHIRFGWKWFEKLKDKNKDSWQSWMNSLSPMLHPRRAKGKIFNSEDRRKAGIPQEWIEKIKNA